MKNKKYRIISIFILAFFLTFVYGGKSRYEVKAIAIVDDMVILYAISVGLMAAGVYLDTLHTADVISRHASFVDDGSGIQKLSDGTVTLSKSFLGKLKSFVNGIKASSTGSLDNPINFSESQNIPAGNLIKTYMINIPFDSYIVPDMSNKILKIGGYQVGVSTGDNLTCVGYVSSGNQYYSIKRGLTTIDTVPPGPMDFSYYAYQSGTFNVDYFETTYDYSKSISGVTNGDTWTDDVNIKVPPLPTTNSLNDLVGKKYTDLPQDLVTTIPTSGTDTGTGTSTDTGTDTGTNTGEADYTGQLTGITDVLQGIKDWVGDLTGTIENAFNPDIPADASLDFTPLQVAIDKFPFSIPWDLINVIRQFNAPREAPKWHVEFAEVYKMKGGSIDIDMAPLDSIAKILRYFLLVIFVYFLIIKTRDLIRG